MPKRFDVDDPPKAATGVLLRLGGEATGRPTDWNLFRIDRKRQFNCKTCSQKFVCGYYNPERKDCPPYLSVEAAARELVEHIGLDENDPVVAHHAQRWAWWSLYAKFRQARIDKLFSDGLAVQDGAETMNFNTMLNELRYAEKHAEGIEDYLRKHGTPRPVKDISLAERLEQDVSKRKLNGG